MSSQAELTYALSPFDYDSPGDCIIQSSGGIHFKVIRQFLATASSVFDDMFDIGTDPANGSLPIVTLAEHSNTLKALLTMLYPTDIPRPLDHGVMMAIVQAYDKYLLPEDRLKLFAKGQSPEMLSAAPAQMYALAWRLKMRGEAVIASRHTHK